MPAAPAGLTLAERLDAAPSDSLSVADIVNATGLAESTVRRLTKLAGWPAGTAGARGEARFPRDACATWMREHQAARVDVTELPGADSDRVTLTEIANRTGIGRGSVSPLPALYRDSADPFPTADALGTYAWGEVKKWLSRRAKRNGPRGSVEPPAPVEAPTTTPVLDVLTTAAIERLTGRSKEAVKTLVRRPEIAALSSGKVGRARVWPKETLLPVLGQLGYLPTSGPLTSEQTAVLIELGYLPAQGKPSAEQTAALRAFGYEPEGTAEQRAWLAGPPRSATELAAHYGVTLSAISQRIGRAQKVGQPVPPAIETQDGRRYDPRTFDAFWNPPPAQ
jgi:hypothetical protein